MKTVNKLSTFTLLALTSLPCFAHWSLQSDESSLHFITTKNAAIAETNSFQKFSGEIADSGEITVSIDLSSVDTQIDLRDERLRDILFETDTFAKATLSAQLPQDFIEDLELDQPTNLDLQVELNLHGQSHTLPAHLNATKLEDDVILVTTRSPLLVDANNFALLDGLNQLQTLAGLNAISPLVPVTGVWTFKLGH